MPTRSVKLGVNAKLYKNTGTRGSPTWVDLSFVQDLTLNMGYDKIMAVSRGSRVNKEVKGNMTVSITGKILDTNSTAYVTLWGEAVAPDAILDLLVLNGSRTKAGSRGLRFDGQVMLASEPQGRSDIIAPDFEAFPTPTENEPVAVQVEDVSGTATYKESAIDDDALTFAAPS
jgi:hypothetical protein